MARTAPARVERLVAYLTDGARADGFDTELAHWLSGSARFRAFAEAHRDKIRKKLRGARGADALRDVRTELRVAQLLLGDPRVELAFEPYGSTAGGPDFQVHLRGERPFNVEVRRLRRAGALPGALLAKLRQLPPSIGNVLVVALDDADPATVDVAAVIEALRAGPGGPGAHGPQRPPPGPSDLRRGLARLGAVVAWCEACDAERRAVPWTNGSARIRVPERGLRTIVSLLEAA